MPAENKKDKPSPLAIFKVHGVSILFFFYVGGIFASAWALLNYAYLPTKMYIFVPLLLILIMVSIIILMEIIFGMWYNLAPLRKERKAAEKAEKKRVEAEQVQPQQ